MASIYQPVAWHLGVNLLDDARLLQYGELVASKNLIPGDSSMLRKRPGTLEAGPVGMNLIPGSGSSTGFVVALHPTSRPEQDNAVWLITAAENSKGVGISVGPLGVATPYIASGPAWSLGKGLHRPQFAEMGDKVYVVTGRQVLSNTGGSTPTGNLAIVDGMGGGETGIDAYTFEGTGNEEVFPRLITSYRQRMVYADLGAGAAEDYLVFSDPYQPLLIGNSVMAANGRAFAVGTSAEGRLMGLIEVMQSTLGSPGQSALLVLRERAAYLITGEPNLTNDPIQDRATMLASMQVSRFSIDTGCASPDTVVRTPYGIVWASHDDVWMFDTGTLPRRVGSKLRPSLQKGRVENRRSWAAAWDGSFYRLALTELTTLPPTGVSTQALNTQWWLHLRRGPPQGWQDAAWFGPQDYGATWSPYSLVGEARYTPKPSVYTGHIAFDFTDYSSGQVLDASLSLPNAADLVGSSGGNIPILTQLVGPEMDGRDMEGVSIFTEKLIQQVELNVETNVAVRLKGDVLLNGGAAVVATQGDILPGTVAGQPLAATLWPDPMLRLRGRTYQLRLTEEALAGQSAKLEIGNINIGLHVFPRRP